MATNTRRTTLIVHELQPAGAWYQQVPGMSLYYDDDVELSGVGMAAGSAGDKTHLVIRHADDPVIGMIGLLQWIDPAWPAPENTYSVGYGNPTFVVANDNMRASHAKAVELGARIHAVTYE